MIEPMILLLVGVWATLIGLGRLKPSFKWGNEDEWMRTWPPRLKVLGPILMVCGVLMSIVRLAQTP